MNVYQEIKLMRTRVDNRLNQTLGYKNAIEWWTKTNIALNDLTPNQMFEKDPYTVYSYIFGSVDKYA